MDKPLQIAVPSGTSAMQAPGILEMILREVQVSCLPGAIPEVIATDVSGLHIGDVFIVGQLVAPECAS